MKMIERMTANIATFRHAFKVMFLRWTPAFALIVGVSAIVALTVAQTMLHHGGWRVAYAVTGAAALVLLAVCLWPVRKLLPHILGLEAEFPQPHNNNETRRT